MEPLLLPAISHTKYFFKTIFPSYFNYRTIYNATEFLVYANMYKGRTSMDGQQPYVNPLNPEDNFGEFDKPAYLNAGLFDSRIAQGLTINRPFASLANNLPISLNPNSNNQIFTFNSCTGSSGESGICSRSVLCYRLGGHASGSCLFGGVCCISESISNAIHD